MDIDGSTLVYIYIYIYMYTESAPVDIHRRCRFVAVALGCLCRSFGLALWIRWSAVYWQHATFAEVLACCCCLLVIEIIVGKLALEWQFRELLGINVAPERRFRELLGVKLAMKQWFQRLLAVKLALERRF